MNDMLRKLAWEGLQKNIVMDGDTIIDKKTGRALGLEVNSTYWKDKFYADFIVTIKSYAVGWGRFTFKWHWYLGYLKNLRFAVKKFLCSLFFLVQVFLPSVLSRSVLLWPWFSF